MRRGPVLSDTHAARDPDSELFRDVIEEML
jgi:hypothetical protein